MSRLGVRIFKGDPELTVETEGPGKDLARSQSAAGQTPLKPLQSLPSRVLPKPYRLLKLSHAVRRALDEPPAAYAGGEGR